MTPRPSRKVTILDGMILVAAVACGFALRRGTEGPSEGVIEPTNWFGRNTREPVRAVLPFLLTLTPAVLLMRLQRPRPRWPKLARQPGMAACCAAIMPIALTLLALAHERWTRDPSSDEFAWAWVVNSYVLTEGGAIAGVWVLGAWLALGLSGRRRAERSGIDRLGRTIGVGWLLVLAVEILRQA